MSIGQYWRPAFLTAENLDVRFTVEGPSVPRALHVVEGLIPDTIPLWLRVGISS